MHTRISPAELARPRPPAHPVIESVDERCIGTIVSTPISSIHRSEIGPDRSELIMSLRDGKSVQCCFVESLLDPAIRRDLVRDERKVPGLLTSASGARVQSGDQGA
jgi:hypothetical protein